MDRVQIVIALAIVATAWMWLMQRSRREQYPSVYCTDMQSGIIGWKHQVQGRCSGSGVREQTSSLSKRRYRHKEGYLGEDSCREGQQGPPKDKDGCQNYAPDPDLLLSVV